VGDSGRNGRRSGRRAHQLGHQDAPIAAGLAVAIAGTRYGSILQAAFQHVSLARRGHSGHSGGFSCLRWLLVDGIHLHVGAGIVIIMLE